ncbi:DUF262 domain-containing protein [Pimelobacter simplex]|uniref:DUF262 domain-containing protein n=1 Tax=Nocardioides simplex TaxID=2045 RepID=A0A7J5E490_NOCSI|nr:DUF262 domain-containing protein [Pimelobacter simplex]KAB2813102.1 DUF262 domain-containing protein [Pimelobacter simplex]
MGVAHLLRDRQLEVPAYQRSYSWTKDEVLAYWHDLRAAMVAEQPVYFLGTVVLTRGGNDRSTVIDGQQRLATTSMLLAAIRDIFLEYGDPVSAAQVTSQYVTSTSLLSQLTEPRLLLNHVDRRAYQSFVVDPSQESLNDFPESGRRIAGCFERLKDELRQDVASAGPYWRQRLINWIQMLDVRTRVIVVTVQDDADAFMIFETLNDRGLALTVADLVKNYLFGLCRDRVGEVEEMWIDATGNFDNAAASVEFTTFLRQWWSSLHGATRERDLYRNIRRSVTTELGAVDAVKQISQAAPLYTAILDPEQEYWSEFSRDMSESARVLLELGLGQHRPLLLAAMSRFGSEELGILLRGLISWSVRGLIVGGIGGGTTERYYAEAAVAISSGRILTATQVVEQLDPIVPSDAEFNSQFSQRRINKLALVHYYLRAIASRDVIPDADERDYVVMPVVRRADYEHLLTEEDDDPIDRRIGNYILVPKGRATEFASSIDLRLSEVRGYARNPDEWIKHGISERQAALASSATEIWTRWPR